MVLQNALIIFVHIAFMDFVNMYHSLKEHLIGATGQSDALLCLHAGMAVYLAIQLILGTRRGSVLALVVIVQAGIFNAVMDGLYLGQWRVGNTVKGLALALIWPALATAVCHVRRRHWSAVRKKQRMQHNRMMPSGGFAPSLGVRRAGPPRLRVIPGSLERLPTR